MLLSVELCSLTLQRDDLSIPNLIASGLFGDGAAAAVVVGAARARSAALARGGPADRRHALGLLPRHRARDGLGHLRERLPDRALGRRARKSSTRICAPTSTPSSPSTASPRATSRSWVCHPGGPKVLEAMEEALERRTGRSTLTWRSLREVGNLSSTSVLLVLAATLAERRPPAPGSARPAARDGPRLLLRAGAAAMVGAVRDDSRPVRSSTSSLLVGARGGRALARARRSRRATRAAPSPAAASRRERAASTPAMVARARRSFSPPAPLEVLLLEPPVRAAARDRRHCSCSR